MSYLWVRALSVRKRQYGLVGLLHRSTSLHNCVTDPIPYFYEERHHLHSIAHSDNVIKIISGSLSSAAIVNGNRRKSSVWNCCRSILSLHLLSAVQATGGLCTLAESELLDSESRNDASGHLEEPYVDFESDCGDVIKRKVKGVYEKPVDFTKVDINLLPTVIIIGRPNVGKSALFNRLIRRREALVYNTPDDHVTRDIREGVAKLGDLRFRVLDSAGLETEASSGSILGRTSKMTANVLARSNFAMFLIDVRAGLHPLDLEVGKWFRRNAPGIKPIVAMNKSESLFDGSNSLKAAADEVYRLGFGDPIAISAETGLGMTELHEALKPMLEDYMLQVLNDEDNQSNSEDNSCSEDEQSKLPLQLAIVGRPNVGKSTLLNTLLQEDRVLVGPEAGLTRDSIRADFEFQGRKIYMVDTAGWLQRTKQEKGPSSLSIVQSRKNLMRAHVVGLVLDAEEIANARRSMTHDEVVIARRTVEEGRGLVVIVNKMDLLRGKHNSTLAEKVMEAVPLEIQTVIPQVTGIPVVFISALEGRGRIAVIRQVIDAYEKWCVRLSTARLNRWLRKVMGRHSWKDQASQPKIKYFTQNLSMGQAFGCLQVDQSNVIIREHFGKFDDVLEPGCHCLPWCLGYQVAGGLSLRVQQLDVRCETKTKSYQRLEFVGDAVLGLALSNYVFLAYPNLEPGQLSSLRAANISTEKLARVAVRHGLHRFIRHNAAPLHDKVKEFAYAVSQEDDTMVYGGLVKAPKILADIVESVAAAIYVDLNLDLQQLWVIFRVLLEPIVTLEDLQKQPQPVTMLFELCQKQGKQVDIKYWKNGEKNVATVYVDGKFIASGSSEKKETAKLNAAKQALLKLSESMPTNFGRLDFSFGLNKSFEIDGAKQKLHELCGKKKWPKPIYSLEKDEGPPHNKKYVSSVQIPTLDGVLYIKGDEKSRVKEAQNSAASWIIRALQESNYL